VHPDVRRVHYPGLCSHPHHDRAAALFNDGFGAMVSVEVHGEAERAEAVCGAVRLWAHATSLGGFESTLERRARYALDAEVCPPNLLRLSVGIEDVDDLWDDLSAALEATRV
jgi:cystathionine gamma-synthase